jgi:chromosome segregation ATPase
VNSEREEGQEVAEVLSPEVSARVDQLTHEILGFRAQNSLIAEHSRELSNLLKDASSVNKFLGAGLYRIDQEIAELAVQLDDAQDRCGNLDEQTSLLTQKIACYRDALSHDHEIGDLLKRLDIVRRSHSHAASMLSNPASTTLSFPHSPPFTTTIVSNSTFCS